MSKSTKRRPSRRKAHPRAVRKSPATRKSTSAAKAPSETKQSRAIAMLRSNAGATIAALMQATGWQQHSVRGFLAGVVRKRLGLELTSSKIDGRRVYRIGERGSAEPE